MRKKSCEKTVSDIVSNQYPPQQILVRPADNLPLPALYFTYEDKEEGRMFAKLKI
ncbi:MAG: hypothetical protein WCQ87_00695 [Parabacteroides sp.]